jgi:hypothetical protein
MIHLNELVDTCQDTHGVVSGCVPPEWTSTHVLYSSKASIIGFHSFSQYGNPHRFAPRFGRRRSIMSLLRWLPYLIVWENQSQDPLSVRFGNIGASVLPKRYASDTVL